MASAEGNSRFVTLADAYLKGFDKIGSSATYPSLTEGGNNLQPVSTKWLENADFLRLENISLSYTFPKRQRDSLICGLLSAVRTFYNNRVQGDGSGRYYLLEQQR